MLSDLHNLPKPTFLFWKWKAITTLIGGENQGRWKYVTHLAQDLAHGISVTISIFFISSWLWTKILSGSHTLCNLELASTIWHLLFNLLCYFLKNGQQLAPHLPLLLIHGLYPLLQPQVAHFSLQTELCLNNICLCQVVLSTVICVSYVWHQCVIVMFLLPSKSPSLVPTHVSVEVSRHKTDKYSDPCLECYSQRFSQRYISCDSLTHSLVPKTFTKILVLYH